MTAALLLGVIHRGGEIARESGGGEQAGARIEQAAGIERGQHARQPRLEGMLADQWQRRCGDPRGVAAGEFARDLLRGVDVAAGIIAQVEDERLRAAGFEALERVLQIPGRLLAELGQPHVTHLVLAHRKRLTAGRGRQVRGG